MSARLLKRDGAIPVEAFAVFDLSGDAAGFNGDQNHAAVTNTDPQTEAARIIDQAHAQAAQIERDAHERIQTTIHAAVEAKIMQEVNPWRDRLVESLEELTRVRSEIVQQLETELVRLALEIARKVIHCEVESGNRVAVELARAAITRVPHRTPATVHLNPEDLDYLESNLNQLDTSHLLTLVSDRSISRGGCLVQTEIGEVDASIEQQFAQIEEALLGQ